MRGENYRRIGIWNLIELLDEYGAFLLEAFDDIAVVHDLVTHIDRRAEAFECLLDGLDGPHHPRAEAAR